VDRRQRRQRAAGLTNVRLAVFGATGPTGRILVNDALDAGHDVTAYARDPGKLALEHARLRVIAGQLDDDAAIDDAIDGADAVISVLGPGKGHTGTPIAQGTQRIVDAMHRHGVRRLVATATPSARDDRDRFDPRFAPMIGLVRLLVRAAYADIIATAAVVRGSSLDWTLLRLPLLKDGPAGPVRTGYTGLGAGRVGLRLSRASLAAHLLRTASDNLDVGAAPLIADGDPAS
jgi:uncharacterized protein YbjT (DUF2867 family)